MASVNSIREGLKTRLATISGLHAYARRPKQLNLPAAVVGVQSISFDAVMDRGADDMVLTVTLAVADPVSDLGEDALDEYLDGSSAKSVKAAIEGDQTLGGIADITHVSGVQTYGIVEVAGIQYVGCDFTVEVTASGS